MLNSLPFEILLHIFSFLPIDSLARAKAVSKLWQSCVESRPSLTGGGRYSDRPQRPWFVAFLAANQGWVMSMSSCYVYNPNANSWYALSLDFLNGPIKPISAINGLVLAWFNGLTIGQLCLVNPFTRQCNVLPMLNIHRKNPAIGVEILGPMGPFRIYVAGGMSSGPSECGATYEPTLEVYDSRHDTWQVLGPIPVNFAVRLTVWTPNESAHINGLIYWITSARVYSIMGFHIESNEWVELSTRMADKLQFATLATRNGKLTLVGATLDEGISIWELEEGQNWNLVGKLPLELQCLFLGYKGSWSGTKCVGTDGIMYLYKEPRLGMVVWRLNIVKGVWEWVWVDGFSSIKNSRVSNLSIKGLLIHPDLSRRI